MSLSTLRRWPQLLTTSCWTTAAGIVVAGAAAGAFALWDRAGSRAAATVQLAPGDVKVGPVSTETKDTALENRSTVAAAFAPERRATRFRSGEACSLKSLDSVDGAVDSAWLLARTEGARVSSMPWASYSSSSDPRHQPLRRIAQQPTPANPVRTRRSKTGRILRGAGLLSLIATRPERDVAVALADALDSGDAATAALDRALSGADGKSALAHEPMIPARGAGSGEVVEIDDLSDRVAHGAVQTLHREARLTFVGPDETRDTDVPPNGRQSLARLLNGHRKGIQACYERGLNQNANLKGKLVVGFTVGPDQRVRDLDIDDNSLGSDEVTNCIKVVISAWTPPFRPSADIRLSYPLVFWAAL